MNFRIRPSKLGKIMSPGKSGTELSVTCKTYLKEWYAGSDEEIESKYIKKGKLKESDAIDFMAKVLGYSVAFKNEKIFENEYLIGEPDVIIRPDVIDTKCCWDKKTLLDAQDTLNEDYVWQLRGYMNLTGCDTSILFYALMDTPEEANFGKFVSFEHLPEKERWIAYRFKRDFEIEKKIYERVDQCRKWLEDYDQKIKLGTVIEI